MKNIITQQIDGHQIITRIEGAGGLIDPEATRRRVAVEIEKTDVAKQINEQKSMMAVYARQAYQASKNHRTAKTEAEKRGFEDEYRLRHAQSKEIEKILAPLAVEYQKKFREMVTEYAVYFTPKEGEYIVEDAEAADAELKMIAATQAGRVLKKDLSEIVDNRGKVYYKKTSGEWFRFEMRKLGDTAPSGAVLDADLTDAQRLEIMEHDTKLRIAALKPAERLAERDVIIDGLAHRADAMRGKLDIQGDKDALAKARAWYDTEKGKVEAKYA
ncbi:MAG: hypothetical protein EHM45_06495 [Desulfobacteraceae bacterium]|nr:MAG: hypothetical protein EHM45_06495 [Desulfobacteraceae bacterium]